MGSGKQYPNALQPGSRLKDGRFQILEVLGAGGFGITYLAQDTQLNTKVAIKEYFPAIVVHRDATKSAMLDTIDGKWVDQFEKGRQRFLREAQTLAQFFRNDGIVCVKDYIEWENNTAYMIMEYLDGENLDVKVQRDGPILADVLFEKMVPLMDALDKLHALKDDPKECIIHRDISPDNIIATTQGKFVLIDFGAARSNWMNQAAFSVMFKHHYSPYEQFGMYGQGPWTDVYSLCATMYYCLTGKRPLSANDRRQLNDQGQDMPWPSELGVFISEAQENALKKGLAYEARERFQSMRELKEALFADDDSPDINIPLSKGRRKHLWLTAAAAAVACTVLIGAWGQGRNNSENELREPMEEHNLSSSTFQDSNDISNEPQGNSENRLESSVVTMDAIDGWTWEVAAKQDLALSWEQQQLLQSLPANEMPKEAVVGWDEDNTAEFLWRETLLPLAHDPWNDVTLYGVVAKTEYDTYTDAGIVLRYGEKTGYYPLAWGEDLRYASFPWLKVDDMNEDKTLEAAFPLWLYHGTGCTMSSLCIIDLNTMTYVMPDCTTLPLSAQYEQARNELTLMGGSLKNTVKIPEEYLPYDGLQCSEIATFSNDWGNIYCQYAVENKAFPGWPIMEVISPIVWDGMHYTLGEPISFQITEY